MAVSNTTQARLVIIGAGLAGSIAYGALRSYYPVVYDGKEGEGASPLAHHYAVMRVKSPLIAQYLGCRAEKVTITKEVYSSGSGTTNVCSSCLNNLYSWKLYGNIADRSIRTLGKAERYVLRDLSFPKGVHWGHKLSLVRRAITTEGPANKPNLAFVVTTPQGEEKPLLVDYDICISTIPLPHLLASLDKWLPGYNPDMFSWKPIHILRCELSIPVYTHQTVYIPDWGYSSYRATLQPPNTLIVECCDEDFSNRSSEEILSFMDKEIQEITEACFGLSPNLITDIAVHKQEIGKIVPIDDSTRKYFIFTLTKRYNIYSLGRHAVWKPLRADDLLGDIEQVKKLISLKERSREYESYLS